ncbi:hypothetical protein JTE90_024868 [Oedothorax gibbosus]|uniref:Uncharacterized protein n=1 Tax=Oedothorax gibbosus TaxID=931172 RepID=A0AAV6V1Z0_9ARAC|nr:hypothetical protein JTE90_024868 [Oedothorax gibbosus]
MTTKKRPLNQLWTEKRPLLFPMAVGMWQSGRMGGCSEPLAGDIRPGVWRTMFFAQGGFYLHPPTNPICRYQKEKKDTLRKNGTIHR